MTPSEAKQALLLEYPLGYGGPGKFEAEPNYVRYYYDLVLDGVADETLYDGDTAIDVFFLDTDDRGVWGWGPNQHAIVLWTSDNGFVMHRVVNETNYDRLVEDCNESEES